MFGSGPGDEYIFGGTEIDTVSYAGRFTPITASVTGGGGASGEDDAYDSIENITGGGGSDTFPATDRPTSSAAGTRPRPACRIR